MGLDTVELVMRCEEEYGIAIADSDAGQVRTVGDLYGLICRELGLVPMERPVAGVGLARLSPPVLSLDWNAEDVWATLVAIVVDQLQVRVEDVTWWATFQDDLGCD